MILVPVVVVPEAPLIVNFPRRRLCPLLVDRAVTVEDVVRLRPAAGAAAPVAALPAPVLLAVRTSQVVAPTLLVREHPAVRIGAGLGVGESLDSLNALHLLPLLQPRPGARTLCRRVRLRLAAEAEPVAAVALDGGLPLGEAHAQLAPIGRAPAAIDIACSHLAPGTSGSGSLAPAACSARPDISGAGSSPHQPCPTRGCTSGRPASRPRRARGRTEGIRWPRRQNTRNTAGAMASGPRPGRAPRPRPGRGRGRRRRGAGAGAHRPSCSAMTAMLRHAFPHWQRGSPC
mmetsp:Transcript_65219/g.190825  ORF Transcript_65219/g.190825 Transcript_65219/m.190825 type:complete len:288 (+) Transcript_65219:159-1022(+)